MSKEWISDTVFPLGICCLQYFQLPSSVKAISQSFSVSYTYDAFEDILLSLFESFCNPD
jgi:hypothetical protein